jgi:hypothetical protein
MIVATVVGKNFNSNKKKWEFTNNQLFLNDIQVVYSVDLFYSSNKLGSDIYDVIVSNDKLVLLTYNGEQLDLSYGIYNGNGFYLQKIELTDSDIKLNKLTSIVLLSESVNYNIYYIGYTDSILEFGDLLLANNHDSQWRLVMNGVPAIRYNNDFTVDFHKVKCFNLV